MLMQALLFAPYVAILSSLVLVATVIVISSASRFHLRLRQRVSMR
jgi:hypothetical protein